MPLLSRCKRKRFTPRTRAASVILAAGAWASACNSGGAQPPPPPPPPSIVVTVSPPTGAVLLGNQATFTANVINTTDTTVSWSVSGINGGSTALGTITPAGVYTAPTDLPSPATLQITATSHADANKSGRASLTVTSDITVSVGPNSASVELGATESFSSTVTSSGHPDGAILWSLSGPACVVGCGTVDSIGNYIAPRILPSPASVTLTAQSVADPSKQASTVVAITSNFSLQLSAPASLMTSGTATIVATLTPVPGSSPSAVLSWSLSGPGCSGNSCGVLTVVTTQLAGGNAIADSAAFTAPLTAPTPNTVSVTVTPQADPSKKAQATIVIQQGVTVSLSPPTATVAANHRITLSANLFGTSNPGVLWNVNGIAGGNTTLGQICVVGSNPCQPVTNIATPQVDYIAPGSIPSPDPVSATAVSTADSTKSGSAQITVINHDLVSVQPATITLAPLGVQGFTASVLGTTNQIVIWQVQGAACSTPGVCGTINTFGTYTAPAVPPAPDAIQIVAVKATTPRNSAPPT